MRPRGLWIVTLPVLLLLGSVRPSWAWRGGWGWRGWWWGAPAVGLSVAAGPYYWWNDPYYPYYGPYYGPYYPPYGEYPEYPAAPRAANPPQADAQSQDNSRYDLKTIHAQIDRMRAQVDYDYADGDISEEQRDTRIHALNQIWKQAKDEADANGGYLTAEQEETLSDLLSGRSPRTYSKLAPASRSVSPSPSAEPAARRADLTTVTDLHLELTTLLDQKLKEGNITQAQHDSEAKYLDQIDQEAHTAASANGGALTADQEASFVQQLHKAYYAINHNLILHE